MMYNRIITVQNLPITISKEELDDYICITDIVAAKSENARAADVVRNWLGNRATLEFLSTWEQIYNPNFKVLESEHFKKQAGLLTFTPSVSEWVEQTNAMGLYVKKGVMVEPLHIRISHLNLPQLSVLFLSCILLKNLND